MTARTMLGVFTDGPRAARAVEGIRRAGLGTVATYTPTADHAVLSARPPGTSSVRVFTLIGGLLGCAIGVALSVHTMVDGPLIVGGRPLISIPPIVIIAFELSMLGAALAGFAGFLLVSGLPQFRAPVLMTERFTNDRFGVLVACANEHRMAVRAHLEQAGAEEVTEGG